MRIPQTTFLGRTTLLMLALASSAALCSAALCRAGEPVQPVVHDALTPLPAGRVQLSGPINDAIETCIEGRILKQSIPDLLGPFQKREETRLWRSEFWGKWFTSAVGAYEYQSTPELKAIVDRAEKGLLATQTEDGYIGTYQKSAELEGWDVWGRKYVLLGLLAYYDATGDQAALDAACREADYTMSQIGPGKRDIVKLGMWTGMAASSILEPVCLLYRRTGERRYLDFAQYIVNQWKEPGGPDLIGKAAREMAVYDMFPKPKKVMKHYGDGGESKAYEMMSCFEGLTELHRITGQEEYIDAVKKVFDNINATEITVLGSGSNWERWCNGHVRQTEPFHEWMETCVSVTWMKFATQLLRLTGDPAYADLIERSAYNALLGAQKGDGTWWSHSNPLEGCRGAAPEQCSMHMNCCVANGPRALMLLPKLAVMQGEAGPTVLFYEDGTASVPLASGKTVDLKIEGDYPYKNRVEIQVQPKAAETFTLSLRIPAWSKQTQLAVNGEAISDVQPGSYAKLNRQWRPGDRVALTFDMPVREIPDPGKTDHVAFLRGPVVLALDSRLLPKDPTAQPLKAVANAEGVVPTAKVRNNAPANFRLVVDVPFVTADGTTVLIPMCDYASAGHPWSKETKLRVWLPKPLDLKTVLAH